MGHVDREHDYECGLRLRHTCQVATGVMAAVSIGGAVLGANASRKASNQAKDANAGQLEIARQQQAIANEQWQTYKDVYAPLEKSMVGEAQAWDSPARIESEAGAAKADVSGAYGRAAAGLGRRMAGYGVDPTSGAASSQYRILAGQGAGAEAGAANTARRSVSESAWNKRLQIANIGRGLPGSVVAGLGSAGNQYSSNAGLNYGVAENQAYNTGQVIGAIGNAAGKVDWGKLIGGSTVINNNTGTGINWNNPTAGWGVSPGGDQWYG